METQEMETHDTSARPSAPLKALKEPGYSGGGGRPKAPDGRTGAAAGVAAKPPDPDAVLRQALVAEAPAQGLWKRSLQWVVAAGITVLLAWLTYSLDGWIPFLSGADLGIHEFGHLLTCWAPAMLCSFAGSFLQVAAPLALGGYFWWRKDRFAVILCGAWAAENLNNVSVYIGDAQRMVLSLFGDDGSGAGHDWHNILGDLGRLNATDAIANAVRAASVCLFVVALGLAVLGFYRAHSE
jgi:hypothetical protein